MSNWRDRYFGRQDPIEKLGLIPAPQRSEPSNEVLAGRELEQRQLEQAARREREDADRLRQRWAEEAEQRRQEADAEFTRWWLSLPAERRAALRRRFPSAVPEGSEE